MGVSALTASLVGLIKEIYPNAGISLFIGSRSDDPQELNLAGSKIKIRIINYRLSPRARIKEHIFWLLFMACLYRAVPSRTVKELIIGGNPRLKALKEADFVGDIRGGDSFSDIYGVRRMVMGSLPSIIAQLLEKRLVLLPQTYGPYRAFLSKRIAGFIMKRSSFILSRDREGMEEVKKILKGKAGSIPIMFCPDVAFSMAGIKPDNIDVVPVLHKNAERMLVGFNISGLLYHGGYTRDNMFDLSMDYKDFVHELVESILTKTGADILLVPHTFAESGNVESDPDACEALFASVAEPYKNRVYLLKGVYDQHEMKGIIGDCDFFIGSRMHACIAALSQGIPTVGVAYSGKFRGIFNTVGAGDMVIDARKIHKDEAIEKICRLLQDGKDLKRDLPVKVKTAQELLTSTFWSIIESVR